LKKEIMKTLKKFYSLEKIFLLALFIISLLKNECVNAQTGNFSNIIFTNVVDGSKINLFGSQYFVGVNPNTLLFTIPDNSGTQFVFQNLNQKNLFNIQNSGNVGIGINNPIARLHTVANSNDPSSRIAQFQRLGTGAAGNGILFIHGGNLLDYNGLIRTGDSGIFFDNDGNASLDNDGLVIGPWSGKQAGIKIMEDGNVGIGTPSPGTKLEVAGQIKITGGSPGAGKVLTSDASGLASWTTAASSQWTTTGSNIYFSTGNVGIGTPSPNAALQLGNAVTNRRIVLFEDLNNEHQFYGFGINNQTLRYQTSCTTCDHVFYAGNGANNSNQLFRISGNGNVEVAGYVKIAGGAPGSGKVLTSDANGWASWQNITGGSSQWTTSGSNIFYSAGNVGIGTASPNAALQFDNVIKNRRLVLWDNNSNDHQFYGFGINDNTLRYQSGDIAADHVFFAGISSTDSKELLRIKGNGNVGIGTSNPDKGKLQVAGSFHVENSEGKQTFHVSAGKQLVFVGDSAYIHYQVSLNEPNSPIQQNNFSMWVSKGIVTQDIAIVDPADWSDFVFEKDYQLRSLEEVAAYIKANGHLPEMPSEAEVKAQGYSVHDINKKLLQKIEELTLYTIQQEEKLKAQQEQFTSLEQRIKQLEANK
jgi:hypothetical protein